LALTIGVAALFFGVVFIIVGFRGGDTNAMTANLIAMMEGKWNSSTPAPTPTTSTAPTSGTSTSGGTHAPATK